MQKANTIPVRAVLSNFQKGGQACYRLEVKRTKGMTQEEFVKMYAEAIEKDPAKARFYIDAHNKCLAQAVLQNRTVNTGGLRAMITIGGSITAPGQALNKVDNPIMFSLTPAGELKSYTDGILAVNETKTIEAVLYTVQYDGSLSLNTIEGTSFVDITGRGLKLTEANQDEGIFLEDVDTHAALTDKATILANDNLSVRFSFDEIPSDKTKARLVILTRNGESKDEYGVIRLERLVEIKHANA